MARKQVLTLANAGTLFLHSSEKDMNYAIEV